MAHRQMREPIGRGDAEISQRIAEKSTDWNMAHPWRTSCSGVRGWRGFGESNFAQLNTQLHFSSFEVGLLLNFRQWPLKEGGIKRVVHTYPSFTNTP